VRESQPEVPRWMIAGIVAGVFLMLFAWAGRDVDRTTAMAPETVIFSR
jgi:hypothetical protein